MTEAREQVRELATEAVALLDDVPEGPVKDALVAFASVIATRTA
jgi:hypothetical protein